MNQTIWAHLLFAFVPLLFHNPNQRRPIYRPRYQLGRKTLYGNGPVRHGSIAGFALQKLSLAGS